jgi:hypothetical protein
MHAQQFFTYYSRNWHTVEGISESFPNLDVISAMAFIIETVYSIHMSDLMVSSKHKEVFWIFNFIREEQAHRLNRLLSSIDIVP